MNTTHFTDTDLQWGTFVTELCIDYHGYRVGVSESLFDVAEICRHLKFFFSNILKIISWEKEMLCRLSWAIFDVWVWFFFQQTLRWDALQERGQNYYMNGTTVIILNCMY